MRYLSTNMFPACEFDRILPYLEEFRGKLGVEIFPMFHEEEFEPALVRNLDLLRETPVSFHEPYYYAEHTKEAGTPEYHRTMEMIRKTLFYMAETQAKYMVFHHNNCPVKPEEKEGFLQTARKSYREVQRLCSENGILLAVENAGIGDRMILDEEEFIRECRMLKCPVLIDIGHAFVNGWDLQRVMEQLGVQIISYHLHNNDGLQDSHRRIHDGKLDFDRFMEDYRRLTPQADLVLEYCPAASGDQEGIREDIRELCF